jgi:hypothetical protein
MTVDQCRKLAREARDRVVTCRHYFAQAVRWYVDRPADPEQAAAVVRAARRLAQARKVHRYVADRWEHLFPGSPTWHWAID